MRRLSPPQLVLSVLGALCAVGFVALWLARDARAVDAAPAPLGLAEADEFAAATHEKRAVLESRSKPPIAERRALAASDQQTLVELHPDRSQFDFVVSAFGAPAAGAVIVLFAPSELAPPLVVAAPGLTLTEGSGVVTGFDGRASVSVAPKVKWRGIVRWTAPDTRAQLSAEFRAVSPIAGYPRVIAIDVGSINAARFLHVEVCSAPSGQKLGGAELYAIMEDGSPAPSELGPTRAVSGADGSALLWWPMGTRLCVDAERHTPLVLPSTHLERLRAGVVHMTLEAAAAAEPTALELSALGALHGRLDPRWAAGGRVLVSGPTVGSLGRHPVRGAAQGTTNRERTATVTATGHWRIEGLPTNLPSDTSRAFAVHDREGLAVRFESAEGRDVPRIVRATLYADVWLAAGDDLELPDPFVASAPVAFTARGPVDLDLDGARVELHLLRSTNGEDAGPVARPEARRAPSKRAKFAAVPRLVAEGQVTATGRVVAPDLPLGHYELRLPRFATLEDRSNEIEREMEAIEGDGGVFKLDLSERVFRAWGRFEHDGRPVEVQLISGQPEGDGRPVKVQLPGGQPEDPD